MTLHCVLGAGEMPAKELNASLNDLKKQAEAADVPFWFLVRAKGEGEPTATDKALMAWLHRNDAWYGTITDDPSNVDGIYSESQETHTVKGRFAPAVVKLLQEGPEEGENAQLLCLFASDNYDSEDDRWLNDVGRAVQDAGFACLALNDGLIDMDFSDVPPPEETASPAPAKTKKAAAASASAVENLDAESAAEPGSYTRDQLEAMDLTKLKEIAADLGIELAPRTRIQTYIAAILGEGQEEEPAEVEIEEEELPVTEEDLKVFDMDATVPFVAAPAMLIVVYNGTVVSRSITSEQALELINIPEV